MLAMAPCCSLLSARPFVANSRCGMRRALFPSRIGAVAEQGVEAAAAPRRAPRAAAAGLAAGSLLLCSPAALAAAAADPQAAQVVAELASLESATAGLLSAVLRPVLSVASLFMIVRIILSWYPEIDGSQMPWAIAYVPTEPVLAATRKVVKPFNGLDVSPIVWVALLSFLSEILTGPQGILILIERGGM